RLTVRGGIKLPTGDASRLREEAEETDEHSHEKHLGEEHEIPSGVHGHDLALGSGSFDYILGSSGLVGSGKLYTLYDVQYTIRTEGDFSYRYQNDLLWNLGVGRYFITSHKGTLSLRTNLSGEYKGMDRLDGAIATDTGIFSLFLGPEAVFTAFEN